MKLPRPYIPMKVRVTVAARQVLQLGLKPRYDELMHGNYSQQLRQLLFVLFGDAPAHLDHDPPLMLRIVTRNAGGEILRYFPDANDPNHLVYRLAEDHKIKTFVRGDGAQRSDVAQRRYLKNVQKNRSQKPRQKIAQRKHHTWPKRKLRGKNVPRHSV